MRVAYLISLMLLGVSTNPPAIAAPEKVTTKVEINGKKYRVTVIGDAVMVANKAMFVAYDVQERDDQRAAVKQVTGCEITDELPSNDAKTRGKLKCPGAT